jgi:hypothetical protein
MAEIPGVEVSDNQATIEGHTGVGIALASAHGSGQEVIIDPKTGQYLGFKQDGDVRAVDLSVVDSAPNQRGTPRSEKETRSPRQVPAPGQRA